MTTIFRTFGAVSERQMMVDARQIVANGIRVVLGTVNRLLPKHAKAVLSGFPDGEDSIMEIARQLAVRGDIKTVVLTDNGAMLSGCAVDGISCCSRKSARGLLHYLTAKYVFFTHGLYLSATPPDSQMCVNVWHGMPIKRIGHLIGRTPPRSTVVVATSEMFKKLVATCFGVRDDEVLATGIPRNDVLVRAARRAGAIKSAMGLAGKRLPRLIVWLPTFRQAVRGIVRTDGRANASIFGMSDMDVDAFSSFLEERNCVCIIKPHPMAAEVSDEIDSEWIKLWRERDLHECGVSLYEMVGAADLLITDASSVYVDYLILDKPVVIAFPDIEEYRQSRGFVLEPVEDFLAGPIACNFEQLVASLHQALDRDEYSGRRARISALFHNSNDDGATARLLAAVLPSPPSSY